MDVTKKIRLELKDVYQMLIAECRYGYTRNNHLMPWGAYDKVKRIIPVMYKADPEYAIYTIKQICDECISEQLTWRFYDGEDDENSNRFEAIKFIEWCLDYIHKNETDFCFKEDPWFPYNYDHFTQNVALDDEPRYNIYEIIGENRKLLSKEPLSENKYFDFIMDYIKSTTGTFRKETIKVNKDDYKDRKNHYIYHIIEPVKKDFYVEHI